MDFMRSANPTVTDVYTDLNGLQNLKMEKNNDAALKKVAEQFESMFINMMMKNMRAANSAFSEGSMFDSQESLFYRDMHDQQLSLTLAHGRGFGIAEAMFRQMSRSYSENKAPMERQIQIAQANATQRNPVDVQQNSLNGTDSIRNEKALSQIEMSQKTKSLLAPDRFASDRSTDESSALSVARSSIASSPEEFVRKVANAAASTAKAIGVEKEVLIAQAALETGWGSRIFSKSDGENSFNLFNIKADARWAGESVSNPSLEYLGGQFSTVLSKFRAYGSIQESFNDFTQFIKSNARYGSALSNITGAGVEAGMDFIKDIHQAGYATDPNYVAKIQSVYERVKSILTSPVSEEASK